jgi:fatty-acyl-CoA synthase
VASAPTCPSYLRVAVDALTRYPDRDALVAGDRHLTYARCADLVSRYQRVLSDKGLRPGETMVALSPNAPEVYLAQVAAGLTGARYSGLHALGSVEDHVALCNDAAATLLLVHPAHAEAAAAIAEQASSLRTVLTIGPADIGEDLLALAELVAPVPLRAPPASPRDAVWMPYTGGTTGRSKGVVHTHLSMVQGLLGISAAWELPAVPRYLACAPITHASVLPVLPTLARGGTVTLMGKFDPAAWVDTVVRERINYAFMVPTMLYALLDLADGRRFDGLTSLETIVYGSAPMSAARLTEALDAFGPILAQGYGQTETLGLGTVLRKDEHDPVHRSELLSSCGRPVPGTEIELLDDTGHPVEDGTVGELCMQAGFVMDEYWKQPELTAETLRDGWLHTGDLAVRDDRGFLHLVDRQKDLIISGAFNIYPREIEEVLTEQPDVSAAAVIGVPDEKWGEAVTAFVVARPGADLDTERLRLVVRRRKGAHQAPKQIHVVDSLPVTSVGKIDKRALRAAYWSGRQRAVN